MNMAPALDQRIAMATRSWPTGTGAGAFFTTEGRGLVPVNFPGRRRINATEIEATPESCYKFTGK